MIFDRLCRKQSLREHTVNTILGILGIVSLCYYNTMDNPYTVIVTLIMSARLFYKLHYLSVVPVDDVVGDSVIVAVLIYTGQCVIYTIRFLLSIPSDFSTANR
jgi:hypothetical protein